MTEKAILKETRKYMEKLNEEGGHDTFAQVSVSVNGTWLDIKCANCDLDIDGDIVHTLTHAHIAWSAAPETTKCSGKRPFPITFSKPLKG